MNDKKNTKLNRAKAIKNDEVVVQAVLGRQIRQSTPWVTERHG